MRTIDLAFGAAAQDHASPSNQSKSSHDGKLTDTLRMFLDAFDKNSP